MKTIVFLLSILLLPSMFSYGNNDETLQDNSDKPFRNLETKDISFVGEDNVLYPLPKNLTLSNNLVSYNKDKKSLFYAIIICVGSPPESKTLWKIDCGLFVGRSCKKLRKRCGDITGATAFQLGF